MIDEGDSDLPRPLEYYEKVFAGAFDYLRENPAEVHTLQNQFVTFSENLLKYINTKSGDGENLTSFFDSDILDK